MLKGRLAWSRSVEADRFPAPRCRRDTRHGGIARRRGGIARRARWKGAWAGATRFLAGVAFAFQPAEEINRNLRLTRGSLQGKGNKTYDCPENRQRD